MVFMVTLSSRCEDMILCSRAFLFIGQRRNEQMNNGMEKCKIKAKYLFLFPGKLAGRNVKVFGKTTGKVFRVVEADLVSYLGNV